MTARIVVEGNLGVVGAQRAYGTEAQKRRYFPWVASTVPPPARGGDSPMRWRPAKAKTFAAETAQQVTSEALPTRANWRVPSPDG